MARKVIFLDRDGTVNEEVNYLHRIEDLSIIVGVPGALRKLKALGFLLVLITNQAGIARGYYTEKDCETLNRFLNEELKKQGAGLDAVYYCPHHPEHGLGSYRRNCHCRKPEIGLFLQAAKDLRDGKFGRDTEGDTDLYQSPLTLTESEYQELLLEGISSEISLSESFMLGDKRIDTRSGHRAGIRSVLLGSGYGKEEFRKAENGDFDAYFESMEEAVSWIEMKERENS